MLQSSPAAREAEAEEIRRQLEELQLIIDDLDESLETQLVADALPKAPLAAAGAQGGIEQSLNPAATCSSSPSLAASPGRSQAPLRDSPPSCMQAYPGGKTSSSGVGMQAAGDGRPPGGAQGPATCAVHDQCQSHRQGEASSEGMAQAEQPASSAPRLTLQAGSQQVSTPGGGSQMQRCALEGAESSRETPGRVIYSYCEAAECLPCDAQGLQDTGALRRQPPAARSAEWHLLPLAVQRVAQW